MSDPTNGNARGQAGVEVDLEQGATDAKIPEFQDDVFAGVFTDVFAPKGTATEAGQEPQAPVYAASRIKRVRATKVEMAGRRDQILVIVEEIQPCTVRQVFYQCSVRGLVDKTEAGYDKVQRMIGELREAGEMPWDWIVDHTRLQRKPATYADPAEAIASVAKFYRKALWRNANAYVEVWIEKDALSGVVYPITESYDVPLMSARGYSSKTFLRSSAQHITAINRPSHIYHLGDHDPSGVDAGQKIEATLRRYAPEAAIHFKRLAVNPDQIKDWNLPSRPTKTTDTRAKKFGHETSVELDAVHPDKLRELVENAILGHLPASEIEVLKIAEESEKSFLTKWAEKLQTHSRAV
jgi:hypothetical protein